MAYLLVLLGLHLLAAEAVESADYPVDPVAGLAVGVVLAVVAETAVDLVLAVVAETAVDLVLAVEPEVVVPAVEVVVHPAVVVDFVGQPFLRGF